MLLEFERIANMCGLETETIVHEDGTVELSCVDPFLFVDISPTKIVIRFSRATLPQHAQQMLDVLGSDFEVIEETTFMDKIMRYCARCEIPAVELERVLIRWKYMCEVAVPKLWYVL